MSITTVELNPGSGGSKPLVDSLTTVDGGAAPVGAVVQMVKHGYGAPGDFVTITSANGMPIQSVDLGAKADSPASSDSGTFSLISLIKRLLGKTPALGQATAAASVPVVLATDQSALSINASGTHFQPGYKLAEGAAAAGPLLRDPDGNLVCRSQVLTDEGSYRVNFANASLAVSLGTATFTNGSAVVSGTGFLAADVRTGDYVKLTADAESAWVQVDQVVSDSSLSLAANYTGTGGTGAASRAIIKPSTGAGGSISVASGVCTIASGTTTGSITEIERDVDWLPLVKQAGVTISQRIANQSIYIGFYDETSPAAPKWFAWFLADGTTATTIKCQSARNPTSAPVAAEIEETTVTLPNNQTTATAQRYRVEVLGDRVIFYINGALVAQHFKSMPGPGDVLTSTVRVVNGTAPASTTSVTVDYDTVLNHDKLQVGLLSDSEQVTAIQPPATPFVYNVAGVIAINTDLLIVDCSQFRSLSVQCSSMGTAGVVTPAWSNDGVNYVSGILQTAANGAGAATFNAAGLWTSQVYGRYLRLRLTTATTAGTTTLAVQGFQNVIGAMVVSQNTAANLQATVTATNLSSNLAQINAITTGVLQPTAATAAIANGTLLTSAAAGTAATAEVASAARVATGNSGVIADAGGGAIGAVMVVSAVTGTTPTLDVVLQESYDNGTTFVDVYHCERLTAAGTLIVPPIPLTGRRRWAWTVGGTTPSFTFAVATTRGGAHPYPRLVQFFDRTAALINGSATGRGVTFQVAGCKQITASLTCAAVTTGGTYKLQGSNDNGQTWFDLTTTAVTAVANSTVRIQSDAGATARHVALNCVSTGTSQTGTVVSIIGVN